MNSGLFNIVRTGYARLGQEKSFRFRSRLSSQVRFVWSGQVRGSRHRRTGLFRSDQSSLVGLVRSGQVRFGRSGQVRICQLQTGQFRFVRSDEVSSGQIDLG